MVFTPGSDVRLVADAHGMAAGSEGVVIGRYTNREGHTLVRFWDGGPLLVPDEALEEAGDASREASGL